MFLVFGGCSWFSCRCFGFFGGVPGFLGCSRFFGCSGMFRDAPCSGVPVFWCSGVPVFRCSGVPVFLEVLHALLLYQPCMGYKMEKNDMNIDWLES